MIPRPLTKDLLKKMFLKVLWEIKHNPRTQLRGEGWGIDNILGSSLPLYWKLKNVDPDIRYKEWSLTKDEMNLAREGVEELDRSGFLKNDPSQNNPNFKLLTEKSIEFAEQELDKMTLPSVNIEQVLSNQDLLNAVRDDYLSGKYEPAIMTAFKMVEEAVRAKAGQGPGTIGHNLMVAAFGQNGVLTHPDARVPAERNALFLLFDGCNGWFRNPSAHRTVGYSDPHEAAQILGLANLLLSMVDKCTV